MTITQSAAPAIGGPPEVSTDPAAESAQGAYDDARQEASGGTRPTFTITDAATACAVSRKTITRKLPELASQGAAKDEDGVWRIPVEALLSVGLHPGRSRAEEPATSQGRPTQVTVPGPPVTEPGSVTIPRDRWDDVRIRLARAEAEAAERALALADARLALRALTAGPSGSAPSLPPPPEVGQAAPEAGPRRVTDPQEVTPDEGIPVHAAAAPVAPAPPADHLSPDDGVGGSPGAPEPTLPVAGVARPPRMDPTYSEVAAGQQAARTGGYVPAAPPQRPKRRRWWQAR